MIRIVDLNRGFYSIWMAKVATFKRLAFKKHDRPRIGDQRTVSLEVPARSGKPLLLWIDDYKPGLTLYKSMFESQGFRVLTAASGAAGLQLASRNAVDVAITDYEMTGMDGGAVAEGLKRLIPPVPVVMFSGSLNIPEYVKNRVDGICDKAGSREHLLRAVHRAVALKRSCSLTKRDLRGHVHA